MRRKLFIKLLLAGTCLIAASAPSLAQPDAGKSPAQAASEIVLAQIGPFSGYPVPYGREVNEGIRACLSHVNAAGGVRGRKISFFELDDRYTGDGFAEAFPKAIAKRPIALISPVGSDALKRMLQDKLLDSQDIVVVNAVPGAEAFRSPGHSMLFHLRAGDKQQIEKIVNHVRTIGMTKLVVLYQDLAIGISGAQVAQDEAARVKGLQLLTVKSGMDAAALAEAGRKVASLDAPGVLIIGAPRFMADGVVSLRRSGVQRAMFVLSYTPYELIVTLAGKEGARGVGIAQTYPNPNGRTLRVQTDFQTAMAASYPKVQEYTSAHFEGCLSLRATVEALQRTSGPITSAALAKTLRSMGEVDLGGFRVDFSKGNVGSRFVDIAVIGSDGKLRY